MIHPGEKIYRLQGKSLDAARAVHDAIYSPTQTLGGDDFYHEYTAELKILGWASRAVQVFQQDGSLPRAYEYGAKHYAGQTPDFSAYMKVQVDYQGRHFVPQDAVLLDAGGIVESGVYTHRLKEFLEHPERAVGVSMPVDFDASRHSHLRIGPEFNKAGDEFLEGVGRLKQHFCDGVFASGLGEHEVFFRIDLTCDKNRRPLLRMAAYRAGHQEPVPLRSNGWLRVEKSSGDFYIVRPDTKTAGGSVLQAALDKIPDLPDKATLWREHDKIDQSCGVKLPPPPLELIDLYPGAPWPFPSSAPAP
ncbi:MAG: hypothetical protein JWO78_349 [Micavibrio sp.]|nr:hypothetical protein [Micavibrio sp.]